MQVMQNQSVGGCPTKSESNITDEEKQPTRVIIRFEDSEGMEVVFEMILDVAGGATAAWILNRLQTKLAPWTKVPPLVGIKVDLHDEQDDLLQPLLAEGECIDNMKAYMEADDCFAAVPEAFSVTETEEAFSVTETEEAIPTRRVAILTRRVAESARPSTWRRAQEPTGGMGQVIAELRSTRRTCRPALVRKIMEWVADKKAEGKALIRLLRAGFGHVVLPWSQSSINTTRGVRQGSPESPVLFSRLIEEVIEQSHTLGGYAFPENQSAAGGFMDDIFLWRKDQGFLPKAANSLVAELSKHG